MAVDIKIGSFDFGNDIDTFGVEESSRVEQVPIPRRHGLLSDVGYRSGLIIKIGGLVAEDLGDDARAKINLIKNAISNGRQILTLYSDRQIEVQKSYFSYEYEEGDLRRIRWSAELLSDDFGFSSVNQTESEKTISASPQTDTFDNNGNVETPIVIRITAGSNDISSGLRIDNLTTGHYFTINTVIAAGTYIEINTDTLSVVDGSGNNKVSFFGQDFFKLDPGTNSIKWTGTATGSPKLKLTYRDKYDGA